MSVRTGIRISGFPVEVTETDDALTLESEGTRDLILDAGSGKVGVGTDDPAVALDVIGTGSFAGAASSLSQGNVQVGVDSGGDPGGELMFHTDDYVGLRCADSGAVSLAVKPSGNVGVGTTAPAVALDVIGTGSFAGAATSQSQGNVQVGVDSGGDPGGELMFHTDDYVGLRCADSGALPFAVKPSGNVGIGDVAPGTQFQMSGTAPYVTLKNSTSENTAGGCESKLIFEDHGDNALGQIEVSHVGTSDDEKGQLILSTNDDSGLQAAITINEEQMVRVSGDGGIEFKDDGDLIKIDSGALTVNSDSNLRLTTKETVGLNIAEAATDAVNYLEIENAAAASGPTCKSEGSADNIDLNISPKGTGQVTFKMPHVDGMVEVRGFESGTGVLGLTADEGDDNGDSWQLVATTDGHLNIKNDISGSHVNMIDIAANATAADSTVALTGELQVNSGTATAAGSGVSRAGSLSTTVRKINGEFVTRIEVDIDGLHQAAQSGGRGVKDIIGNHNDGGNEHQNAYLTRITNAVNGTIYKIEMACIEAPLPAAKISLASNSNVLHGQDDYDSAGTEILILDGTGDDWGAGLSVTADEADLSGLDNDYIYLAMGESAGDAEITAGKFIITFYGADF